MSSSMKNAMKTQKVHRERHQNEERAHLGPLEKKKDYKVRARHQERKNKLLKKLHKKALERNPDEFHFHMHNSQVEDGRHKEKAKVEEITVKNVRQDLTYIKFRRTMEQKRIEKLRACLHFLEPAGEDEPQPNTHLLFVDTQEDAATTTPAELLNTVPDLLNRPFNRLTKDQLQQLPQTLAAQKQCMMRASSEKTKSYKELCRRVERDQKLQQVQVKLEAKLNLMQFNENNKKLQNKLPPPKLVQKETATEPAVYKWPKIRKK